MSESLGTLLRGICIGTLGTAFMHNTVSHQVISTWALGGMLFFMVADIAVTATRAREEKK